MNKDPIQPDQEFWRAQEELRPKDSSDLTRLRRIEDCAKRVVDENDNGTPDGLAVALQALGMLVRE
jgi:hypothetical protein